MSGGEWAEGEWEGTLTEGFARRAGLAPSDLELLKNVEGRSDLEVAINDLVEALDGTVEFTEPTDGGAETHLIVSRVHLKLREAAWKLVEQSVGLAVSLVLLNPGSIVNAVQLVRTVIGAATILAPAELEAVNLVRDNHRCGRTTSRNDLDPAVDVDSLIARGVVVETENGLTVSA